MRRRRRRLGKNAGFRNDARIVKKTTLNKMPTGITGTIEDIFFKDEENNDGLKIHLLSLGFRRGEVIYKENTTADDYIIVKIKGAMTGLSKDVADSIIVSYYSGDDEHAKR